MKTKKLFSLLLAAALLAGCFSTVVFAATSNFQYGQTEARKMLSMVNTLRKPGNAWYWNETNSGKVTPTALNDLVYDYALEEIAMQRAAEIAVQFSHTRPDGSSCFTAYDGVSVFYSMAENIAMGTGNAMGTAEAAFNAWCETNEGFEGQGHRRNMLSDDVTGIGIGHVIYNGAHYWVQEFGAPLSGAARTEPLDGSKSVTIRYPSDPQETKPVNPTPVTPDPPATAYSVGDVDGNGKIEPADARLALRAAVKLELYAAGSAQFLAADVDNNGEIDPSDARSILRAAVGLQKLNGSPSVPVNASLNILPDSIALSQGGIAFVPVEAGLPEEYDTLSYDCSSNDFGARWVGELSASGELPLIILCVTALNSSGSGNIRVKVEGLPDVSDAVAVNITENTQEDIVGFEGVPDLGARWRVSPGYVTLDGSNSLFMLVYHASDILAKTGFQTSQEVLDDAVPVIEGKGFAYQETVTEDNPNGEGYADFHYFYNRDMGCELCLAFYMIDNVTYEIIMTCQYYNPTA